MSHWIFWIAFHLTLVALLAWDLRPRKKNEVLRENLVTILITVIVGMAVGVYIFLSFGAVEGIKYYTAYVTELALSIDNLFVFMVIFSYFAVPEAYQHKTLFYGVIGAILFRAIFLFVGVSLIERFHFVMYVFGAILLYSSYKLLKGGVTTTKPSENPVLGIAKRYLPLTDNYDSDKFIIKSNKKTYFSPLILVLLVIETTDIMFAVDSIPAVLTITGEFFTAYTSNIMAIIGLRALFSVVDQAMEKMKHLGKGLALVLAYLGLKTFGTYFGIEVPTVWNMGVILGTIGFFVAWSLIDEKRSKKTMPSS